MEKTTLQVFRLLIPGGLIWLTLFSFFLIEGEAKEVMEFHKDFWFIWILPAIYLAGAIYSLSNGRQKHLQEYQRKIDENIKNKLLNYICTSDNINKNKDNKLNSSNIMLNIFYFLVDSNNSLQNQSKGIYLSGLFWSSSADLAAISAIAAALYSVAALVTSNQTYFWLLSAAITVHYLSRIVLLPYLTALHIRKSDRQLEFIRTNLQEELVEKAKKAHLQ